MKNFKFLSLAVVSALFIGCGSSSSSTTSDTGTGYYVDSAVAGVSYTCGSESNVTGSDGSFQFQKGQGCTFSVGDMTLRSVDTANLTDGVILVEDNITVATLLQTLDSDGDASNGITILPAVIAQLKADGFTSIPNDPAGIFESVKNVEGYDGSVKTETEVIEHLEKTQEATLKTKLAGKKFYAAFEDGEWGATLIEFSIDSELKELSYQVLKTESGGTDSGSVDIVEIDGNVLYTKLKDGEIDVNRLISETDYALVFENGDDISSWYKTEAKAQEAYDNLTKADEIKYSLDKVVGKTFYQYNGHDIFYMTFGSDGVLRGVENGESWSVNYTIDGNVLTTVEDGENETHTLVAFTDSVLKFRETDGSFTPFYFSQEDAIAYPYSDEN